MDQTKRKTAVAGFFSIPAVLACAILAYEIATENWGKAPESLTHHVIRIALFVLFGLLMAWWGLGIAPSLLRQMSGQVADSQEMNQLLEVRNRQLQMLVKATMAMSSILDLEQVGAAIVSQIVNCTQFMQIALILGPNQMGDYSIVASHGLPSEHLLRFTDAMNGSAKGSSPVEWCRRTHQPVVVENLNADFRTAELADIFALTGATRMIAVPLLNHEHSCGTLIAYLDDQQPISTSDISLLSTLAFQAAVTIENATMYTLITQNRTRLERAVELLENVSSALVQPKSGIASLLEMIALSLAGLFEPACIRLAVSAGTRWTPHAVLEAVGVEPSVVELQTSTLCLPVTLGEQHFGLLELFLAGEGRFLDEEEVRILQAFVHLIAAAMGNAMLVADMQEAVNNVQAAYTGTLEALTKALEIRDHETTGHSLRVVQYSLVLARCLGVEEHELSSIMHGALLHDIGKIGIPDAILRKPGPLTSDEWAIMHQHTRMGYEMLKGIEFLNQAAPIILYHHERWDGQGYPDGLIGEEIPLGARIFAVADAYDAITSDRPYRKGRSHESALTEIQAGAGTQFDDRVVRVLLSLPRTEMARFRECELDAV